MGLGGPNLVKGATGQVIDAESLGGARLHTAVERRGALHGEGRCRLPGDASASDSAQLPAPRRAAARAPPAARDRRGLYGVLPADHRLPYDIEEVIFRIFDAGDYAGVPARVRARDAVRQRAAGGPAGGADRQPPRLSEGRRAARASAASSTPNRRARWRTSSRPAERAGHAADLLAGRLRLHGGPGSGARGHHPRGRRDGGDHGLRHRAQDRADAQSRQRRGLLRHGRPGLRPQLHLQLAHRAHRRDGGRFGGAGALLGGAGKAQGRARCPRICAKPSSARAPITSAGWMRATPPPAATATP